MTARLNHRLQRFARSALALAVCAALGAAQAADKKAEKEDAVEVDTEAFAQAGVAGVTGDSNDRAFFGQYNGMRNQDVYGIFNFGYSRLDTATGTWLDFVGSNLGLQTRELGASWRRQGQWSLSANYGELWAVEPYTVNTGVTGGGTTAPRSSYLAGGAGSGNDTELSTKRKGLGFAGSYFFTPALQFEADFNSEKKTGSQLFGIGNNCPSVVAPGCGFQPNATTGSAVLFFPLPIDATHNQANLRLNYGGEAVQLSGGYYGSFYTNDNGALNPTVPGTLNNPVNTPLPLGPGLAGILQLPVASSPDNQFNYFDLAGNYNFLPQWRANFKLAYSQARQDQSFTEAGLSGAPAGVGNLDGEVIGKLAQFRVVGSPLDALTLAAEYRYSDTDDKTPVYNYNLIGSTVFTNQTVSRTVNSGKLEATYRFPWAVQGTAGWGFNSIDRGSYTPTASYVGVSALREDTDETSWWLQVRRSLTESLAGMLSYTRSTRDGSNWLAPAAGGVGLVDVSDPASQLGPNAIYAPTLADRDRDRVRFLLTWAATDALSVQLAADYGKDSYNAPTQFALQDSKLQLYTLDVNYTLSEDWSLNGYLSTGSQQINQARPGGYVLAFDDQSFNAGLGFAGKLGKAWQVGGNFSYLSNVDEYAQTIGVNPNPGNAELLATAGGLPDVEFRRTEVKLFGAYALSERSTLRADAVYQRYFYNDWTYNYSGTPFLYSDNTTLYLQPTQNVGYLGVSYVYTWK
jgi:MtrB/PioB family decaheme-associated outer membrane protein